MPLYIADFMADTLDLEMDEIGVYFKMLCFAWARDGALPSDKRLKIMLQKSFSGFHGHTYNRIVPKLLERYFYCDAEGNWRQKRLEKELQNARKLSANGAQNVAKRWAKTSSNEANQTLNGYHGNTRARDSTITTTKSLSCELRQEPGTIQAHGQVCVLVGTPQWQAWESYYLRTRGKKPSRSTKDHPDGAWFFPTEWPPDWSSSTSEL